MKKDFKDILKFITNTGYTYFLNILMLILIVPVFLGIVFLGNKLAYPDFLKPVIAVPWILFYVLTFVFSFILILLIRLGYDKFRFSRKINNIFYISLIITTVVAYLLMYYGSKQIAFHVAWDVMVVRVDAIKVALKDALSGEIYLRVYENNIPICYILGKMYIWAYEHGNYANLELVWIQAACIMSALSMALVALSVKKITNNVIITVISYIFAIVLIGFSGWNMVPYTDSYGIMFPILSVFLFIGFISASKQETELKTDIEKDRNKKKALIVLKKLVYIFMSVFFCIAGCFIKPTLAIVYIALLLIGLIKFLSNIKKEWGYYIFLIICILMLLAGKKACVGAIMYETLFVRDENIAAGIMDYFYMGQNENTCGSYSNDDTTVFGEFQFEGKKVREKELFKRGLQRLADKGVVGVPVFWLRKMVMTFNDGTFGFKKEVWPEDYLDPPVDSNNKITETLRKMYWVDGNTSLLYCTFIQMIWICLLIGIIGSCLKKENSMSEAVFKIIFVGVFLYQLLFEARARYLYVFLPLLIVLSMSGYLQLVHLYNLLIQKISDRKKVSDEK